MAEIRLEFPPAPLTLKVMLPGSPMPPPDHGERLWKFVFRATREDGFVANFEAARDQGGPTYTCALDGFDAPPLEVILGWSEGDEFVSLTGFAH